MSKVEEIERAVEKLHVKDFVKLAAWVDERRQRLDISSSLSNSQAVRNHSAFLNSYVPEDEGLYDDGAAG